MNAQSSVGLTRHRRCRRCAFALTLCSTFGLVFRAEAREDIEFVAEHLTESAMDNRYATLPLWSADSRNSHRWSFILQASYAKTSSANLKVAGPMFSVGVDRRLSSAWNVGAFAFTDVLDLAGDNEYRPLQTLFSPNSPIERPVDARFDHLDGRLRHYGAGIHISTSGENGLLGFHRWIGGVLWQRVELRDYRLDYQILGGTSIGMRGQIDFDTDYAHLTPFVGMELARTWGKWSIEPHALFAMPIPKRGVVGHINGPGFDLRGNTADTGEGKHFGDPSLVIGFDITYLPDNFSIDVGTLLTQRFLEPFFHKGIDTNWLLSGRWRY